MQEARRQFREFVRRFPTAEPTRTEHPPPVLKVWEELPAERKDATSRDEVMKLWSRAEVLRLTNWRANQNRKMGDPGPEGSIGKMAGAILNIDIYEQVIALMGADGLLYGSYEMNRPETAMASDTLQKAFLRSRANSIEGGTPR